MTIIFTGANYWKVKELPKEIKSDFVLVEGFRWIKGNKEWSKKSKLFPCPKHYQVLTNEEAKAQELI